MNILEEEIDQLKRGLSRADRNNDIASSRAESKN